MTGVQTCALPIWAVIEGDLHTFGGNEPVIEEGAIVRGSVVHRAAADKMEDKGSRFLLLAWVRSVVALFVVALVMIYGARRFTSQAIETVRHRSGKSLLTGILWLILFIPASILLLVTLVGIPLAVGGLLITGLMCLAATGASAVWLGRWVLGKISKESGSELTWVHALIGAVVYKGIQLLPGLGGVLTFILTLFFFGATFLTLLTIVRKDSGAGLGAAEPVHKE